MTSFFSALLECAWALTDMKLQYRTLSVPSSQMKQAMVGGAAAATPMAVPGASSVIEYIKQEKIC